MDQLPSHLILLDSRRAAAILGCSERTLERRRVEGNGPRFRKLGGLVRYSLADINAYVEAAGRGSTSEAA